MSGASGRLPPESNGRPDGDTTQRFRILLDEELSPMIKLLKGLKFYGSIAAGLLVAGFAANAAVSRYAKTEDLKPMKNAVEAVERQTTHNTLTLEQHDEKIGDIKAAVREMATEQKQATYRIERRVDAVLDQLQPVARRTGATVVPRPPRAVMKPTVEVIREP